MGGLIARVLAWWSSGAIASLLTGAGLTLISYAGLEPLVSGALDELRIQLGQLPGGVIGILGLMKVPEALSIIGSALLTRVAYVALQSLVGVKRT